MRQNDIFFKKHNMKWYFFQKFYTFSTINSCWSTVSIWWYCRLSEDTVKNQHRFLILFMIMNFAEFKKKHDFAILIILTKKKGDISSIFIQKIIVICIFCSFHVLWMCLKFMWVVFLYEKKTHHLGPLVVNVETKELFTMRKI